MTDDAKAASSTRGQAVILGVLGAVALVAGVYFDGWGWLGLLGVLTLVGGARTWAEASSAEAEAAGDSFRAATALLGVAESRSPSVDALRALVDQADDQLLAVATAVHDGSDGLLAVTRDRIVRVDGSGVREWPRSLLQHLDTHGAGGRAAVVLTLPAETLRFERVKPEAAAARVRDALRG